MKRTTPLIGGQEECREPVSKPRTAFGWRQLGKNWEKPSSAADAELLVAEAIVSEFGVYVTRTGDRTQSHDIEVSGISWRRSRRDPIILGPGLYEVKSLWRKNGNCSFDRRFKVGSRGELIYGRRDHEIKSFAISLENELDSIVNSNLMSGSGRDFVYNNADFVEQSHEFIDRALSRKHSREFEDRLHRLAKASLEIPSLSRVAANVLSGAIGSDDIIRGFSDIEGIFVVAGPLYTLVTKAEMPNMLTFDSASAEGPKIRLHGDIPIEHRSKVVRSKTNKTRKGKKSK